MLVLITYDVETTTPEGRKRLRQVARQCVNYGQRVQNSVFECLIDPAQFAVVRHKLERIIDPERDSLRYYFLGKHWRGRIEHSGVNYHYDPEGTLLV
jgi:CRISPR-associated protein Cas2